MNHLRILLIIALTAVCGLLSAATGTAALYAKLQAAYKNLSSFQAELKQTNYYPQLKRSIVYNGRIYFTPGRLLMSFDKPSVQRMQIQNGQVELYDAASQTLFRSPMQPQFGRMNPVEILQLYWAKSAVSLVSEDKSTASVKLLPAEDDLVRSLSATLNKTSGLVSKLSYTDKGGNSVTYEFSRFKLNTGIAASVWAFQYPKGVQIIER